MTAEMRVSLLAGSCKHVSSYSAAPCPTCVTAAIKAAEAEARERALEDVIEVCHREAVWVGSATVAAIIKQARSLRAKEVKPDAR